MVPIFIVDEIIRATLVGAVGRDEATQFPLFQKSIVPAATIARIGHAVLPNKTLLP